ncbi:glycosyltransferase family 2 protein [Vibrio anguillarum]|uniref:Glycosyltransferase n=11 Tax=Vibrio anguillarum TaxID=55601 RepID=A0A191W2G0_VIBAN|nr:MULTISPECIES: glycosyltransferase [Vibrio]AEH33747.1 hypothetical protein VAA_01126 [Vibrio anguillarum 775]AGU58947.1 hypothetical protein N175_10965 [Vibrio anguillarum M3]ARV25747.1 glycosyl transferase 2 family protein [Vibrio anguillarum]ASF91331.1 hypothetical protein CEA93_04590 [Vibrio anguillarum]ASF99363.1 hypothetical protein CEG15_04095 [Vibrio anguillarum]
MTNNKKKVTIGICTYRRPEQLKELLVSIFEANDTSEFILTIAIVDNDENRSANEVASLFYNENINVIYHCEFSRNISDVRNKCIGIANDNESDYILFLDDDETISPNYFISLAKMLNQYDTDVVIGPVITCYYPQTSQWVIVSKLFERVRKKTGTILSTGNTGNALVSMALIEKVGLFNRAFGQSGGEDSEFFYRCKQHGAKLTWCDETEVFEYLSLDRANLQYAIKRGRRGGQTFSKIRKNHYSLDKKAIIITTRSIVGLFGVLASLPLIAFTGKRKGTILLVNSIARLGQIEGLFGRETKMYGE